MESQELYISLSPTHFTSSPNSHQVIHYSCVKGTLVEINDGIVKKPELLCKAVRVYILEFECIHNLFSH